MEKTKLNKKTIDLLDKFDDAAQNYGWTLDQGVGINVNNALHIYNECRMDLEKHLLKMQMQIAVLKNKFK